MMYGYWNEMGMPGMMLVWIILIVLAVYGLVRWIKHMGPPHNPPGHGERMGPAEKTALQILEEKYVHGEISREEFLQKRDDLTERLDAS